MWINRLLIVKHSCRLAYGCYKWNRKSRDDSFLSAPDAQTCGRVHCYFCSSTSVFRKESRTWLRWLEDHSKWASMILKGRTERRLRSGQKWSRFWSTDIWSPIGNSGTFSTDQANRYRLIFVPRICFCCKLDFVSPWTNLNCFFKEFISLIRKKLAG